MDIFNHFACYTTLPVLLDDVAAHIKETRAADRVLIYEVDFDPKFLRGICWLTDERGHNGINHHRVARILVSKHLTPAWRRLVICKELLHLLDSHLETAQTRSQVSNLIEHIVLPADILDGLPTMNDRMGLLHAMMVMFPRDAIEAFREKLERPEASVETIAKMVALPERLVRVCFSPSWKVLTDGLTPSYATGDQAVLDLKLPEVDDGQR